MSDRQIDLTQIKKNKKNKTYIHVRLIKKARLHLRILKIVEDKIHKKAKGLFPLWSSNFCPRWQIGKCQASRETGKNDIRLTDEKWTIKTQLNNKERKD